MILKKSVTPFLIFIVWIDGVFGASYSKVYVNSGSNAGPYQYVGYGAPPVAYGAPIAKLTAPPLGSVVPYARGANFIPPCVSPCVQQQPVANAGLVAYTAPRASVVVTPDVPANYEYSYVVYDDGTGDQKAARELSDGGVVQGQYSFLQPDGYVREVRYTADAVNGYNAVVNYMPGGVKTVGATEAKPCSDTKPEALKEQPKEDDKAESIESSAEKAGSDEKAESSEKSVSGEKPASGKKAESGEKPESGEKAESTEKSESGEKSDSKSAEAPASGEASVSTTEGDKGSKDNASAEDPTKVNCSSKEPAKETKPKSEEGSKEGASETVSAEVKQEQPPEEAKVEAVEAPPPVPAVVTNARPVGYVSYDQLLKCIQKMQNMDLRTNSPLTYILLPSNAKPC